MNQEDIEKLAERLTADERPKEIPSSEECRNRVPVVIRATDGKETWEEMVDGVVVGTERLMLVWRWEKRLGVGEESPADFRLLPYDTSTLVEVRHGLFRLNSDEVILKQKPPTSSLKAATSLTSRRIQEGSADGTIE